MGKVDSDGRIYRFWMAQTADRRCLRRKRWNTLKSVIIKQKVRTVLEFGSGVSTLLMASMGLKVDSYETDKDYIEFMQSILPLGNVQYKWWNNEDELQLGQYDLALIDGILPRLKQLELGITHAKIVALDDVAGIFKRLYRPIISRYERLDHYTEAEVAIAIFKINSK